MSTHGLPVHLKVFQQAGVINTSAAFKQRKTEVF
jgi:hypothetical protein